MLIQITEPDGVRLDLRYATADNITGRPLYQRPVAMLRQPAHTALRAAIARAAAIGLRLTIFDAFRPMEAQWALWHALPDPAFVANPADGTAMHPRGVAIDLTLDGLNMGTGFDDMTPRAAHAALDMPPEAIRNRALLLGIMVASGWEPVASEWWHYQLANQQHLPQLWAKDAPEGPM